MADQAFKNVIGGKLVDSVSGERYDVLDPTTGEVYATAPMSSAEDVDRAYVAAAEAFGSWGDTTPKDRATALLKIADAVESLEPDVVEFWQGSRDRMHRRLQYVHTDGAWTTALLQP